MWNVSRLFQVLRAAVTVLLVLGGVHAKPHPDKPPQPSRGDIQPEAEERQDSYGAPRAPAVGGGDSYGAPQSPVIDGYGAPQAAPCQTQVSPTQIPGAKCAPNPPKCTTTNEKKCEIQYEDKCNTVYESQCRTEYDDQCQTTYEEKCEIKYDTVYEDQGPNSIEKNLLEF